MSTVNHCQIHLSELARMAAADATYPIPTMVQPESPTTSTELRELYKAHSLKYADEHQARREFTGPHFHGIKNIAVSEGTVDVVLPDGTTYMYPLHTVARIKVYTTDE